MKNIVIVILVSLIISCSNKESQIFDIVYSENNEIEESVYKTEDNNENPKRLNISTDEINETILQEEKPPFLEEPKVIQTAYITDTKFIDSKQLLMKIDGKTKLFDFSDLTLLDTDYKLNNRKEWQQEYIKEYQLNDDILLTKKKGYISILNIKTQEEIGIIEEHFIRISFLDITSDNNLLLVGINIYPEDHYSLLKIFNIQDKKEVLTNETYETNTMVLSNDQIFVAGENYYRNSNVIYRLNAEDLKPLQSIIDTETIGSITPAPNDKYLISQIEGGFKIWDLLNKTIVLKIYFFDNDEWLIINSENYFHYSSPDVLNHFYFTKGKNIIRPIELLDEYHNPNVLINILKKLID